MYRPLAVAQLSDPRLLVLALVLALAASLVSLSLFRYAEPVRGRQRLGWLLVAAAAGAFGLWSAHFVLMVARGTGGPFGYDWVFATASLLSVMLATCAGFAIAGSGAGWRPAVGGAVNGTGMGLMHYVGLYAVAMPGAIVGDLPLVVVAFGMGLGLSAASFAALKRLRGHAALWSGAGLLTLALVVIHFCATRVSGVAVDLAQANAVPAHHLLMVAVVVVAAALVLGVGFALMLIDRKNARENLRTLQELVDNAIEGVVLVWKGRITRLNRRITEIAGIEPKLLIGKSIETLLGPTGEVGSGREMLLRTAAGRRVPVRVVHERLASGEDVYVVHDLTERRSAEAELQRRNKILQEHEEELRSRNLLLDTALTHMSQGLCMYDNEQRVVVCNERYAALYGLTLDDVKPGTSRREIVEKRIARGLWAGSSPEAYLHERTAAIEASSYSVQEMNDGRTIATAHVPMPGGGWVCTHEDITDRRLAQARIEHLARHDALTDLPNRLLLREELEEIVQRLRPGEGVAVHCLDLDRFKEVNDATGHAVGDELLQGFAARLRRVAGDEALLARTGGNEFVIVQNTSGSPTEATDLAAELIEAMNEPFVLGEHFQVVLSASIGIAMAPDDGADADQLIKHANQALHRAKQEQRGHYRFFENDMDARMRARHELECNLRNALTGGELELNYQPLLNLKRNEIACFEALLRWRTSSGELIPPSAFVPLAEETGLIVPMGEWALRQALEEAAKWPRQIRVAVNLSPVQFNSRNLSQVVMSALAASGVEPSRLELEITESLLLQDHDTTLATLHQLRDLGVRIALDDFGTGFSSLNYLRAFPFDKLKIDQCFIDGLAEGNEESLAIVRAVARLGASLGIATTAEGVETELQMDIARREGFTEVQGYWIGRPKSAEAIAAEYDLYGGSTKARRASAKPNSTVVEPKSNAASKAAASKRRVRRRSA